MNFVSCLLRKHCKLPPPYPTFHEKRAVLAGWKQSRNFTHTCNRFSPKTQKNLDPQDYVVHDWHMSTYDDVIKPE